MQAVARGNRADRVQSRTGSGRNCANPLLTSTNMCSENVFINNIGAVRIGDLVAPHPFRGCGLDSSRLSTASVSVFVNNRGLGRLGDQYTNDNIIISGSSNVFSG